LRVGHERERAAAAETFVQEKVESVEIWQLEALDLAFADAGEMLLDALSRHFVDEQRVIFVAQRYQPDVGRVALIARTRVR
jgi:hypothetical protein